MLKILTSTWLASAATIAIGNLLINTGCARQIGSTPDTVISASSNLSQFAPAVPNKSMAQSEHGGHRRQAMQSMKSPVTAIAKLTTPSGIKPQTIVPLVINIRDNQGKPLGQFTLFQEKLMHLIVVSNDLQYFDHLHPVYKQNGRFEVTKSFPNGGRYTLLSHFKPTGQEEQVSVLNLKVDGTPAPTIPIDMATSKSIGNIKASLELPKSGLKAGKEAMLVFKLQQSNGALVNDLRPYLGEKGHLVTIEQSSPLAKINYIHAHPHMATNMSDGEIHFLTKFPKPGKYKIWGQFNRAGKIVIADFWVNVS